MDVGTETDPVRLLSEIRSARVTADKKSCKRPAWAIINAEGDTRKENRGLGICFFQMFIYRRLGRKQRFSLILQVTDIRLFLRGQSLCFLCSIEL